MNIAFLGDIALILEVLIIASGLLILGHRSEQNILTKFAAYLLIGGGLLLGSCTAYQYTKHHFSGGHERASKRERRNHYRKDSKRRFDREAHERGRPLRNYNQSKRKIEQGEKK